MEEEVTIHPHLHRIYAECHLEYRLWSLSLSNLMGFERTNYAEIMINHESPFHARVHHNLAQCSPKPPQSDLRLTTVDLQSASFMRSGKTRLYLSGHLNLVLQIQCLMQPAILLAQFFLLLRNLQKWFYKKI